MFARWQWRMMWKIGSGLETTIHAYVCTTISFHTCMQTHIQVLVHATIHMDVYTSMQTNKRTEICWLPCVNVSVGCFLIFVYVAQFHHSADGFQPCLQSQGPEDRQMGQNLQRCEILLQEVHVTIALSLFLYLLTSCLLFYHCTPHCLAACCTDLFSTWEKGE